MASLLHSNRSAGRSKSNTSHTTISTSLPQLTLSTRNIRSGSNLSHRNESPRSPFSPASSRSRPKHIVVKADRDMSSQKASSPFPNTNTSAKQSSANHAKLHRRGGSGSLPGPPSPFVGGHQFTTPYATYEESYPDVIPTSATASSTPKIKPYLRKMSSSKDDQGTIDLNKSIAENERLAGLGISDFASRSAADVSFGHPSRRQTHARTTSIGSQVSNGSGTFRPGQPFVHPATKVPRPYTPPGASYASSLNDEHANESDDVVEDEFRLGAFRTKRSMSITSTNPTPLSQSHTASDLGLVPKLTSASQSNLSTMSRASSPSGTKGRSRRGTDHSELALSPQTTGGRPSIDKAFSLVSGRRSDPDTQSRDELIRNARRKFEEKEARKDSKQQKRRESDEARKEAAKQRKQSTASRSAKSEEKIPAKKRKGSAATVLGGAQQEDEELADAVYGRSYENYRPAHDATLPRYGDRPGESEKTGQIQYSTTKHEPRSGSWMRFSTWVQTRMLSCGGGGH